MTYGNIEVSDFAGEPISLYEFQLQTVFWRYCSGDRDISYASHTYTAIPISDSGAKQTSGDTSAADFTVELPATADIAAKYRGMVPSSVAYLTVRSTHYGDNEAVVTWVGTIAAVKRKDDATSQIVCRTLAASFDVAGVRLTWARGCPYALYDSQTCRVDKTAFAMAATITALTGNTVTADLFAEIPNNDLAIGFLEWTTTDGVLERRGISQHDGGSITVYGLTDGLSVGLAITVYPGCSRTTERCDTRFNNMPNYGGCPQMPGVSPFSGDQVF